MANQAPPSLDSIEVLGRTNAGSWFTIRGAVTVGGTTKIVHVDVPKNRFDGMDNSQEMAEMKRALRCGLPYAR